MTNSLLMTLRLWLCILAVAYAAPASAQDWFRQRTFEGLTAPVGRPGPALPPDRVRPLATIDQQNTTQRFAATGLPLAIPDNNTQGISSTLAVPAVPAVSGVIGVVVSINLEHTFRGDLVVSLTAPNGTVHMLSNRLGGSADNVVLTDQALTGAGANVQGNWVLRVTDLAPPDTGRLVSWGLGVLTPAGTAFIDLTISLEANPTGDDNGNSQGVAGSETQDKWERIVQHFADAVYESTNGAHKIRKVRVFRKGRNFGAADIRWIKAATPGQPATLGGIGLPGGHIDMYEVFKNGGAGSADLNMLGDEVGSGYTMAHEWGHYFLGLYDEYVKQAGDVVVKPSMMSSQWEATGGNHQWLNFSIANRGPCPCGDFQDTILNKQHRAYGASAWQVLARPVSADPVDHVSKLFQTLGPRVAYPELALVAPAGTAVPRIDLPATAARSALDIVWMRERQNLEIVIDRSGSMSAENRLAQAKTAAKLLLDQSVLGQTRIGVTAFDSAVTSVFALTAIDTEVNRTQVKAAIDSITLGGSTAIGEAASSALTKIMALVAPGENKVVFLLSDGQSNSGRDPLSVVPAYAAAHVPLFTFGFGSDADSATMSQMASGTGGRYFFSPTTLGQITAAFQAANQVASSSPGLGAGSLSPSSSAAAALTVPVDASLSRVQLSVVYTGSAPASAIRLTNPSGQVLTPTSTTTTGGETLVFFDVDQPGSGGWQLRTDPSAAGTTFSYAITGIQSGVGYDVNTGLRGYGNSVSTPGAVVIESKLSRRQPIAGATVTATVTKVGGAASQVQLLDAGAYPDLVANDGTYTGSYTPTGRGNYSINVQFSNPSLTARETYRGGAVSPGVSGVAAAVPADTPVTENFVRNQTSQFSLDTDATTAAPVVVTHPASQQALAGGAVAFPVIATGEPAPTYRWQRQPAGSTSFTDLANGGAYAGATTATLTVSGATAAMAGDQFRCVVTNSAGAATSNAATMTVYALVASPSRINIGAIKAGPASALQMATPAQQIAVTFTGASAAWTVTADQPWVQILTGSGTGAGRFTVAVADSANLIGGSTSLTATLTITAPSVGLTTTVPLSLAVTTAAAAAAPFGAFDTPASGSALSGSFAVTGWALDDVGVERVEIWRDRMPGETTPVYGGAGPGNGKIFIANPFFVSGARPDVELAYGTLPLTTRAGWGYLLLSYGLWSQGNGPVTLHAFAYDLDGHVSTLGSKSITVGNATSVKPFGSIDTPSYGQTVSGAFFSFGWALTPNATPTCAIAANGVQVSIDSGTLQPVSYGDARPDIAAAFPGLSNGAGAGGAYYVNSATLSNGTHQIGWFVTDSCGRSEGVGSRFFSVLNTSSGTAVTSPPARGGALAPADWRTAPTAQDTIDVRRGVDTTVVHPNSAGARMVPIGQGERVEVVLPPANGASYAGYQVVNGDRRPLPLGSSLDASQGIFYWQPGPGFLGAHDLEFVTSNGSMVRIRAVVGTSVQAVIDTPQASSGGNPSGLPVSSSFTIAGWAIDEAAHTGTGIDTVHVWAYPAESGEPIFLGFAAYGDARPDIGALFGEQFTGASYSLSVSGLAPGAYDIVVYPHSAVTGDFHGARVVRVVVPEPGARH